MLPVGLEVTLNISSFWKSSLKYAKSAFSLSIMSVNKDLHSFYSGWDVPWVVEHWVSKLDMVSSISCQ